MKIAIGSDPARYECKEKIQQILTVGEQLPK